jgi:hypothetical protein
MRSLSLGALLLSACLVPNPEYDPSSGTSTSGATSTTSTTTSLDPTTTTGPAGCRSDADCDDGLFCDGEEVCDPAAADADARGCAGGSPPCDAAACSEDQDACLAGCDLDPDADDDGVDAIECGGLDCDDGNPAIAPGKEEVCDDGDVDEDCDPATVGPLDGDGDGLISGECCNPDGGALHCGDDCDDALPGLGVGDWAHCSACGASCGVQQACEQGGCVTARRVFVTSTQYSGNLGGLAGADTICQTRADAAALDGAFKAYLVTESSGLERLDQPDAPFVRLDGVKVADDWSDLSDESLDAPIDRDEFRQPAGYNAWTGLRDVDGGGVSSCDNWSSAAGGCLQSGPCGAAGEIAMTGEHWDGYYIFDCNQEFRLYCVEQ